MENTLAPQTQEEPVQHISPIGRVVGVFWEPKRTFQDIVARPGWWAPLLILVALGLLFIFVMQQTIGMDVLLRQQLEQSPQIQEMPAEQREAMIATQLRVMPIVMYVAALVSGPVFYIIAAVLLMVAFRIVNGSEATFKQSLGITTHAFLPMGISSLMAMAVMRFINPADFSIQNPVMTNLGWLVGSDAAAWLRALAGSIDLFAFWIMFLLAVGFAATKRKLTTGSAFWTVFGLWAVMVVLRVGWAAARG